MPETPSKRAARLTWIAREVPQIETNPKATRRRTQLAYRKKTTGNRRKPS